MSATVCIRCGEELRDPTRNCGFCRLDRLERAVRDLVAAAGSTSTASLLARVDAINTLRNLGYSQWQVVEARAQALDGFSVEEIVRELEGSEDREAVAA